MFSRTLSNRKIVNGTVYFNKIKTEGITISGTDISINEDGNLDATVSLVDVENRIDVLESSITQKANSNNPVFTGNVTIQNGSERLVIDSNDITYSNE